MNFFEFIENVFAAVVDGAGRFILSPVFPFFFWTAVAVGFYFLLRAVYLRLRDRNLSNITYSREFSVRGAYASDEVELIETVCNRGFFPLFGVDVEAYFYNELRLPDWEPPQKDGMQYFVSRFNLLPYMRIRRRHRVVCMKRGYYGLQSAVTVKHNGEQIVFECPAELRVYPKPVSLSAVVEASGRMQGDERASRQLFPDPFTVSGVRDYRFGDTVSQINFKVSARTWMASGASSSPLKVNDREFCADRRLAVFMDFHLERDCGIDGKAYGRRIEAGLAYAAAVIREAIYGGFSVSFSANCRKNDGALAIRFPLESGEKHMIGIFDSMAELFPRDGASFSSLLEELAAGGEGDLEIVLFILCASPETDNAINALRRAGNNVRVVFITEDDEEEGEVSA
ncbi:MAG: DUF58 domain-containing protein [Clostridia bacterium]|nr:DUF58 domain-containing protein [Clostridia bacterium]